MTDTRKVVIISGGMGGVGRATAEAFAREQYRIALLYRHSSEEEIAAMRHTLSGEHLFIPCDIGNTKEVARAIDDILRTVGQIDVAVHAAVDPIERKRILDMDESVFRSQFEAGFFGAFNFFRPVAEIMKKQQVGTLIGITSDTIDSPITFSRMGAYTVGKIALRGLLRELHREVSPSGVRVLAVAPGLMRTRLNSDLPEKFFEIAEGSQGSTLMTPEEVARTIVRLCKDTTIASGVSYFVHSENVFPL